jgi:hypothetical protein
MRLCHATRSQNNGPWELASTPRPAGQGKGAQGCVQALLATLAVTSPIGGAATAFDRLSAAKIVTFPGTSVPRALACCSLTFWVLQAISPQRLLGQALSLPLPVMIP